MKTLVVLSTAVVLLISLCGCTSPWTPEAIVDEACAAMSEAYPRSTTVSYASSLGVSETTICHRREYGPKWCSIDWQVEPETEIKVASDFWWSWPFRASNPIGVATSIRQDDLRSLNPLIDWNKLTDEQIDGMGCFHFRGKLNMNAWVEKKKAWIKEDAAPSERDILSEALQKIYPWEITVELWVGKTDKLIRQLKWDEKFPLKRNSGEETWASQSTVTKFYDFG